MCRGLEPVVIVHFENRRIQGDLCSVFLLRLAGEDEGYRAAVALGAAGQDVPIRPILGFDHSALRLIPDDLINSRVREKTAGACARGLLWLADALAVRFQSIDCLDA